MANDLQPLYNQTLLKEVEKKTESGAIIWTQPVVNVFTATQTQLANTCPGDITTPDVPTALNITWDFQLQKTQLGANTFKYNLDVRRNSVIWVSVEDGVQDLFEAVEIVVLDLEPKIKEALGFVQNL